MEETGQGKQPQQVPGDRGCGASVNRPARGSKAGLQEQGGELTVKCSSRLLFVSYHTNARTKSCTMVGRKYQEWCGCSAKIIVMN